MTALALLCEIIATGGKISADFYRSDRAYALLQRYGLLREAGVVETVVCGTCDEAHSAPVIFEDGQYGYYCPKTGECRFP